MFISKKQLRVLVDVRQHPNSTPTMIVARLAPELSRSGVYAALAWLDANGLVSFVPNRVPVTGLMYTTYRCTKRGTRVYQLITELEELFKEFP